MIISAGLRSKSEREQSQDSLKQTTGVRSGWRLFEALTVRSLLAIWLVLSVLWGGTVAFDLYHRATVQADMSRDVERELDQSLINASCNGPACTGEASKPTENWSAIASTYMRFGGAEIEEYTLGPPLIVLAVGLAAVLAFRRRRSS